MVFVIFIWWKIGFFVIIRKVRTRTTHSVPAFFDWFLAFYWLLFFEFFSFYLIKICYFSCSYYSYCPSLAIYILLLSYLRGVRGQIFEYNIMFIFCPLQHIKNWKKSVSWGWRPLWDGTLILNEAYFCVKWKQRTFWVVS